MQALRLLPLQDRRMPQWRLGTARAGSSERKRAMHGGVEEGDNISLSLSRSFEVIPVLTTSLPHEKEVFDRKKNLKGRTSNYDTFSMHLLLVASCYY